MGPRGGPEKARSVGDPNYRLLILDGMTWDGAVRRQALARGVETLSALDVASARFLIAGPHPVLVIGPPERSPMQLHDPGRVDVALIGPGSADEVGAALAAGAVDWLRDPTDPVDALRMLAAHQARVSRRAYQHEMLDALARALQHHLQPANAGQAGVARVVLHEVRNAMAALELNVGALAHGLEGADAETRETLSDLAQLTAHLSAVLGSGRTLLAEGPPRGDVSRAVRAAVTMTGTRSSGEVRVQLDPDLPAVALPTHQLAQILLNAMLNALHAGAVEVRVSALGLPDHAHIAVTDDGAGMTADDLSQALEPGFTTKETGSGLGLAICREILQAVGGSIRMASQFGAGTTVVVEVPWADGPASA